MADPITWQRLELQPSNPQWWPWPMRSPDPTIVGHVGRRGARRRRYDRRSGLCGRSSCRPRCKSPPLSVAAQKRPAAAFAHHRGTKIHRAWLSSEGVATAARHDVRGARGVPQSGVSIWCHHKSHTAGARATERTRCSTVGSSFLTIWPTEVGQRPRGGDLLVQPGAAVYVLGYHSGGPGPYTDGAPYQTKRPWRLHGTGPAFGS